MRKPNIKDFMYGYHFDFKGYDQAKESYDIFTAALAALILLFVIVVILLTAGLLAG